MIVHTLKMRTGDAGPEQSSVLSKPGIGIKLSADGEGRLDIKCSLV